MVSEESLSHRSKFNGKLQMSFISVLCIMKPQLDLHIWSAVQYKIPFILKDSLCYFACYLATTAPG